MLLQGDQDPQTPMQTIRELMVDFPNLDVTFVPQTGLFRGSFTQPGTGRTVAEDKENFRVIVIPAFCKDLANPELAGF